MKGIVFRLFEEFVCAERGPDFWEEVVSSTSLVTKEPFVGPGTYDDADLVALLTTTAERLPMPIPDALRAFGRFAFQRLLVTVPVHTASHRHPRDLLLELDGTVHSEVRKLWRDARPPRFRVEAASGGALVLHYHSTRGLCPLVEGLLMGAAEHYGVKTDCEHTRCRHRGDAECIFEVRFEDERASVPLAHGVT